MIFAGQECFRSMLTGRFASAADDGDVVVVVRQKNPAGDVMLYYLKIFKLFEHMLNYLTKKQDRLIYKINRKIVHFFVR